MTRFALKTLAAATLAALALSACATMPNAPIASNGPPMAQGSVVALGQPVAVADVILTPMRVIEDSRCPINARCVWAGRLVVETRVDGAGWRETVPMTMGEPQSLRGYSLSLVSAEPGHVAGGKPLQPGDYRFAYEGRWEV